MNSLSTYSVSFASENKNELRVIVMNAVTWPSNHLPRRKKNATRNMRDKGYRLKNDQEIVRSICYRLVMSAAGKYWLAHVMLTFAISTTHTTRTSSLSARIACNRTLKFE